MKPTLLITGAAGFLGTALRREFAEFATIIPHTNTQKLPDGVQADLRDPEAVAALLAETNPDIVIHTAAYREPDFCEEHPAEAMRLNAEAVASIAKRLPASSKLVYVCTDYVFDGETPPFLETDEPSPVSIYGKSKLVGEEAALSHPNGTSVRVPVLIGTDTRGEVTGFIQQMVASVKSGEAEEVDNVLWRFPTWIDDVSRNIRFLIEGSHSGIWHVSSEHGGTRYQLTCEVADHLGLPHDHLTPSTAVIPRPAQRPMNSQLSPAKLLAAGGPGCAGLTDVLKQLGVG